MELKDKPVAKREKAIFLNGKINKAPDGNQRNAAVPLDHIYVSMASLVRFVIGAYATHRRVLDIS